MTDQSAKKAGQYYSGKLDRRGVIQLLATARRNQSYRFGRQTAMIWLANFPGDLEVRVELGWEEILGRHPGKAILVGWLPLPAELALARRAGLDPQQNPGAALGQHLVYGQHTPANKEPGPRLGNDPFGLVREIQRPNHPVNLHQIGSQTKQGLCLFADVPETQSPFLVVAGMDAGVFHLDVVFELQEELLDSVQGNIRVEVEFILADTVVLQIDHTAPQGGRKIDAQERRVIEKGDVIVDFIAVTKNPDAGKPLLPMQDLAAEAIDHHPHGIGDLGQGGDAPFRT